MKNNNSTGKKKILISTIYNWIGHFVFIAAGFVMPRIMDENLGQDMLGIWDFGWSIVSYFRIFDLGIGSSISRYIAFYTAREEYLEVKQVSSSVFYVLMFIGFIMLLLVLFISGFVVDAIFTQEQSLVPEAKTVIFYLGLSIVVRKTMGLFRGVITGMHRWGVHNIIQSSSYIFTISLMIVFLLKGASIGAVSIVYFYCTVAGEIVSLIVAYKVCPSLSISPVYYKNSVAASMFNFGIKSFITSLTPLLIGQGSIMVLANTMGAASIAVYARPIAILKHISALTGKLGFVLTPAMGALSAKNEDDKVKDIFIRSAFYTFALVLPAITYLLVYGDMLIELWMGKSYVNYPLIIILSIGLIFPISQRVVIRVLIGLNKHGNVGLLTLLASSVIYVIGLFIVYQLDEVSITSIAIVHVSALTFGYAIIWQVYACRVLSISLLKYYKSVLFKPVFVSVIFFIFMMFIKHYTITDRTYNFLLSLVSGAVLMSLLYWNMIIGPQIKQNIITGLNKMLLRRKS